MDPESTGVPAMDHDEMLSRIGGRFESRREAEEWYREQPLPGLSGSTAMELVEQGRGAELIEYLAAVDAGVYS